MRGVSPAVKRFLPEPQATVELPSELPSGILAPIDGLVAAIYQATGMAMKEGAKYFIRGTCARIVPKTEMKCTWGGRRGQRFVIERQTLTTCYLEGCIPVSFALQIHATPLKRFYVVSGNKIEEFGVARGRKRHKRKFKIPSLGQDTYWYMEVIGNDLEDGCSYFEIRQAGEGQRSLQAFRFKIASVVEYRDKS